MRSIVDFSAIASKPELIGWTLFNSCLNIFHGTKVLKQTTKNVIMKEIITMFQVWKYFCVFTNFIKQFKSEREKKNAETINNTLF